MGALLRGVNAKLEEFPHPRTAKIVFWGLLASVIYAGLRSLSWPLVHDSPLFHFIAWRMLEGDVPYRDIFDNNMPGIYLTHYFLVKFFGTGDFPWRMFDLAVLSATAAMMGVYGWRHNRLAAIISPLIFFCYHLGSGSPEMGQRDFILCLSFIVAVHGVASAIEEPRKILWLIPAGLFMGYALTLKPFPLFFAALLVVLYIWKTYPSGLRCVAGAALFVSSMAALPIAVSLWIVKIGAFDALALLFTDYLLPFYGSLNSPSWAKMVWHFFTTTPLVLVLLLLVTTRPRLDKVRYLLVLAGLAYGMVHFFVQRKGWFYHSYPFTMFLVLYCGMLFGDVMETRNKRNRMLASISMALLGGYLFLRCFAVGHMDQPVAVVKPLVEMLVKDIEAAGLDKNDTVQVLDTTEGGIHALLRLRIAQPTRFIYDFHFYHDTDDPRIQKLQNEFLGDLRANKPRLIVAFHRTWMPPYTLARLDSFPALKVLLNEDYAIRAKTWGYTVYEYMRAPET